jgi:hypothetical protein
VSRVPALIRRVSALGALTACRPRAGPRGGVCDLQRNGTGSCAKRRDRRKKYAVRNSVWQPARFSRLNKTERPLRC